MNHIPQARALEHDDSLRLVVEAFNTTIHLHLAPNHELFHPNAVFHQDGQSTLLKPSDFRVYRGYVVEGIYSEHWWISNIKNIDDMKHQPGTIGWARIIIRNDIKHTSKHPLFEGTFSLYGDIHHIKLKDTYRRTKRSEDAEVQEVPNTHMIIYRDSDKAVMSSSGESHSQAGCGFDGLNHPQSNRIGQKMNNNPLELNELYGVRHTRPALNPFSKRAVPTGCPTSQRVLYMGVAADCTYTKFYKSTDAARMQIINDWNSVSAVYASSFNIGIGLINITIMDSACPNTTSSLTGWNQACSTTYSITQRLSDFSRWRGSIGDDGAGLWHLMTNCATGQEVGIAWLSQVCTTDAISSQGEYTSGTGVSSVITDEWKVVAHEIGHGFGAIHDCNSQTCPCSGSSCQCCPYSSTQCDAGGRYFMNPVSNASSSEFSPCSMTTICENVPNYMKCLETPGTRNITSLNMCGNGIKEAGEDCDPGGQESNCCDATTCKFRSGAVCDDVNDLCCDSCQFRPANYTCRAALTECDIAEVCSGTSGDCPSDSYKEDSTSCGNGLQCASGQCTSRDSQCLSRGTTYNITRACGAYSGCQVTCQDPRTSLACITFPGYFSDGTSCGIGGVCRSGRCSTDNVANNVRNWINSHKEIVIPVAIVVGLLVLFCLFRCCCYSRNKGYSGLGSAYVVTQQPPPPPQYSTQPPYYPPPPPPPGNSGQPHYEPPPPPPGWIDPALYNGSNLQSPLPAYSQNDSRLRDTDELNNTNVHNRVSTSPTVNPQMPIPTSNTPSSPPPFNAHNNQMRSNRPYDEGVL
ncbi:hypothetical protein G6F57_003352 [Rhizopus arrhizus]|nr:hypothetical protein G6F23_001186 [Rhizopus arrhizus]KAG1427774.1 hypothetical protein G6F58_000870 [Rhizopus delemar]KAG0767133.1 hypothetical protein G6F24_003047 [Rhizopus arrhizus]KAG0796063.1 hypothetical protein G6F21_001609 [Rhizopus arrhizus]KAG0798497.1 hypothetical protein G6F22_004164 [Rhizopus arrhizus]